MRSFSIVGFGFLLSVALGSTGCVSSGKYDALAAENAKLAVAVVELEAASQGLAAELSNSVTENLMMRGTYDQLLVELEAEVASGQIEIQQLTDGIQLNVSDQLLFDSGSAALNEAGVEVIGRVAEKIRDERTVIDVEGHTDTDQIGPALRGRFATNWELAGARAAQVVRQLSEDGVTPGRLRAVSRGPFDPIASNDTAEGRAKNRRTEIVLRPMPE